MWMVSRLSIFADIYLLECEPGAHIPDISSDLGFFDVLYLGVFIILSPAFDPRFYHKKYPPANLVAELSHAKQHFSSLLHIFSRRFFIEMNGEIVWHSYVVDRMIAEFAAAAVNLAKGLELVNGVDDPGEDGIKKSMFVETIEGVLKESRPQSYAYYSRCLASLHKHFTWTGPKLEIYPQTSDISLVLGKLSGGVRLDHPARQIYSIVVDPEPLLPAQPVVPEQPVVPTKPIIPPIVLGKRRDQEDVARSPSIKRIRLKL
jgi:hypothetical protein